VISRVSRYAPGYGSVNANDGDAISAQSVVAVSTLYFISYLHISAQFSNNSKYYCINPIDRTISGVISQSINSVFTSTYDNYYIEVDFIVPSVGGDVAFRLRSSGTDKTTNYVIKGSQLNAASIFDYGSGTTNLFYFADPGVNLLNLTTLNVSRPAISGPTAMKADTVGNNAVRYVTTGRQTETTTFDGFTVYNVGSNNMNGTIKVFGVNQ
jgi:hypothetical protein